MSDATTECVATIADYLVAHQQQLVTAESCTGGLLAATLTDRAGSSHWFEQGWITYANTAKSLSLGIPPERIAAEGAVSEATAAAMAEGALRHSGSDYAVSITGIAGPSGGTPEKPVGTVCFGWANQHRCRTDTVYFTGNRAAIRLQAVHHALAGLVQFFSITPPLLP